jgi:hypothetical protein
MESVRFQSPLNGVQRRGQRVYAAILAVAGPTLNGWRLPAEVLRASVEQGLWASPRAPAVLVDHPGLLSGPSVTALVGLVQNVSWDSSAQVVRGEIHLLETPNAQSITKLLDQLVDRPQQPDVGLSAVLDVLPGQEQEGQQSIEQIVKVWSVDVVMYPAAGGRVEKILNACKRKETKMEEKSVSMETSETETEVLPAAYGQLMELKLAASGLPAPMLDLLRGQFAGRVFRPADLDKSIEQARQTAAALVESQVVQGHHPKGGQISGMFDSLDRVRAAYEALMGLDPGPGLRDVPRLSGIRELYVGLTGDLDLRGIYQPQRAQFAISGATIPVTSTTMSDLTANLQNKILMEQWARLAGMGYTWWRRAVQVRQFNSLKPTSWITAGGMGDLPTVADGGVYSELAWSDKAEAVNFIKKGGFVSLTLEMIDKDDVQGWRLVGQNLATAALRTISASVAGIFTGNPALSEDGNTMFHSGHGNLGSTALSPASWDAAVQGVFKQTEYTSGKRLAVRPDRVLVPIELRKTAISLFYSEREPGGANNDINAARLAADQDPVIVVPEFTDANDWVALAPPEVAPVVGVGFRFGEQPEIFSAADPSSFLMFFQDALPVKVRWFYAVGAIDYRGAYKAVVP